MIQSKRFFPIGKLVKWGNVRLVVQATADNQPVCTDCYFSDSVRKKNGFHKKFSCYIHRMDCSAFSRRDHHHVIFVYKYEK